MSDAERDAILARIARLDASTTVFTYEERDLVKQCLYACGVLYSLRFLFYPFYN
jgi:hypothetical protein